ncbi:MAG TPA: hypothetical protein VL157_05265 [Gemmatimonadaceae bacterium]|nr:hypothetical protein [Gemmatimonadaceae bacterium]
MWSPDLLGVERVHLLQLLVWGVTSLVFGAGVIVALRVQQTRALLAWWFAVVMAVSGAGESVFALVRWRGLAERDFASALRLTTHVRLAMIGEMWLLAGATVLVCVGVVLAKRLELTGIGVALVAHGSVLFILDRLFLSRLTPGA